MLAVRVLPCEATARPEQVHKGNTNKTIYIEDQVGFLSIRMRNQFMEMPLRVLVRK